MSPGEIERNYNESFYFLNQRRLRQVNQLVLLNNLNRGDQNIASTLLLTLFNRLVSSSYDDKLQVKFLPSQGINQEQLSAYNVLAQSDYQEMEKAKLDYDWIWDTLFFGRGYCETIRFDKKRKIMQPHIVNPLVLQYDPYFENPQEWRYYSKWLFKTRVELERLIKKGMIKDIESPDEIGDGIDPYIWAYKIKRDAAKKVVQPPIQPYSKDVYMILEYYGYNEDGEKCVYWTDRDFSKILLEEKLDLKDGEPMVLPNGDILEADSRWPIVIKEAFREPHSSVSFSVADLLEDKHRAKSVLLNLAYIAAKDKANPIYWYDPDKVQNLSQFLSRQVNQHIPVEGDGKLAIGPLNTQEPMTPELIQFISMMTQEANEPLGTGNVLQPLPGKKQTATEAALTQQVSDTATSLQSKILQFGEKDFWSHWFARYRKEGKNLGEKMANIVGVKGMETQKIDLGLFNVKFPPGVQVYSAKEAEYKEMILRRDLQEMLPVLSTTMEQDGLRNFYKHILMPKYLNDPSLIEIMFPKTIDELKAERENESLADNKFVAADKTDNHTAHIYIHNMLQPKTWATWMHLAMHEEMLAEQKEQMLELGILPGNMGAGVQQRITEAINFKDLPPDGQQQLAQRAGIRISGQPNPNTQQETQPAQQNQPAKSAGKPQNQTKPQAAVTPLKQVMSTSQQINPNQQI